MVPRPYIPIRLRYAALTASVLSAGVLIFSAAAYFEVRRSAIELATDRLIAITTQIGQLFETPAAATASRDGERAAPHPSGG